MHTNSLLLPQKLFQFTQYCYRKNRLFIKFLKPVSVTLLKKHPKIANDNEFGAGAKVGPRKHSLPIKCIFSFLKEAKPRQSEFWTLSEKLQARHEVIISSSLCTIS